MNAKKIVMLGLKVIGLAVILVVCFTVASAVSGLTDTASSSDQASGDAGASLLALFGTSLLETAVLAAIILRSRGWGWRLVGAIFLAFYGLNTVVAQIESIVFLPSQLPPEMVPQLFVLGAILAGTFSPLAVLILGKMRRGAAPQAPNPRPSLPPREWAWKLALIAIAYVVLYFSFGYFVAWKTQRCRRTMAGPTLAALSPRWPGLEPRRPGCFSSRSCGRCCGWPSACR